jgi:hypothetical protein
MKRKCLVLLLLIVTATVHSQTNGPNDKVKWHSVTAWSGLEIHHVVKQKNSYATPPRVDFYWEKGICNANGVIERNPRVALKNSSPGPTIENAWVNVEGIGCGGKKTKDLYVFDIVDGYEFKIGGMGSYNSFQDNVKVVKISFDCKIGDARYHITHDVESGIDKITIDGIDQDEWLKEQQQKDLEKSLEASKKRTDALINDPAKQPKTNIKGNSPASGVMAENRTGAMPETVAATTNSQQTQNYINQAQNTNNDAIMTEFYLGLAKINSYKQGGSTQTQQIQIQQLEKLQKQREEENSKKILNTALNIIIALDEQDTKKTIAKAENGDIKSLYFLKEKYIHAKDYPNYNWCRTKLASLDNRNAMYSLAVDYNTGEHGLSEDKNLSKFYCNQAAALNDMQAMYDLAVDRSDEKDFYYCSQDDDIQKRLFYCLKLDSILTRDLKNQNFQQYDAWDGDYNRDIFTVSHDNQYLFTNFHLMKIKGLIGDYFLNYASINSRKEYLKIALHYYTDALLLAINKNTYWPRTMKLKNKDEDKVLRLHLETQKAKVEAELLQMEPPVKIVAQQQNSIDSSSTKLVAESKPIKLQNHSDSVVFNLNTTKDGNNKLKASATKVANTNQEAITKKQNITNGQKNTLPISDTILNNSSIANVKKPVGNSITKDSLTAKPEVTTVKNSSKATANAKSKTKTSSITNKSDKEKTLSTYNASFTEGVKLYNAKNWEAALQNFSKAVEASDIIYKNNWNTNAGTFDTTIIVYAGNTAQYAKKPIIAISYYKRLADASVIAYNNTSLVDDYKFMLSNYLDAKDSGNFYHYYTVCQTLYPTTQWDSYEFNFIKKKYTLDETVSIYHQLKSDNKISDNNYQNFADYFANPRKEDVLNNDKTKLKALKYTAIDAYKNVGSKSDTNYVVAFNIGSIYSDIIEYENDNAKEKSNAIDSSINWLEKSFEFLKHKYGIEESGDKSIFSVSTGFIKNITKKKAKITFSTNDKTVFNKAREELINAYKIKRDSYSGKDAKSYKLYDKKLKETEKVMISE